MNKKELMQQLETGDYGDQFTSYSDGYIGDVISEIADSNVDIYYSDLFEWVKDNYGYCEDAVKEGLISLDKDFDFIKLMQIGQYEQNTQDLYENLDDSIKYFIYDNIEFEEISEELQEFIDDLCDDVDNNEQLENILEQVKEFIENIKDEEETE